MSGKPDLEARTKKGGRKMPRRSFLAMLGGAGAATAYGFLGTGGRTVGISTPADNLIFDGEIDGRRVQYFVGDLNSPTTMNLYNDQDQLEMTIEDAGASGTIGDHDRDRLTVFNPQTGDADVYTRDFAVIDGRTLKLPMIGTRDPVLEATLTGSRNKLAEANTLYAETRDKIVQNLTN